MLAHLKSRRCRPFDEDKKRAPAPSARVSPCAPDKRTRYATTKVSLARLRTHLTSALLNVSSVMERAVCAGLTRPGQYRRTLPPAPVDLAQVFSYQREYALQLPTKTMSNTKLLSCRPAM